MNKLDLLYGVIIGFLGTLLGSYLYFALFTNFDFMYGIQVMRSQGYLGKVITLGSILDIGIFFLLLKMKKELMARGIILAFLLLTILSLFLQS